MEPARFAECLTTLRWSKREIGTVLRCDEGTVRQWGRGTRPIPKTVADWLNKLAAYHEKNPPPDAPVVAYMGPGAAERRAAQEAPPEA